MNLQKYIDEMTVEECIDGIKKLDICANRALVIREKAVQLLEKQVPKKPNMEQNDQNCRPTAKCPICGTFFIDQYCMQCGQKIDWE